MHSRANQGRIGRRRRRRGVETLEIILVLPVLVLATVGALQYGLMMVVHHAVFAAVHEGAREASKGADIDEIGATVDTILAAHNLAVGPGVRVLLQDDMGVIDAVGDASLTSTKVAVPPAAGEVRVVVLVSLAQAPLPNALVTYGIDFSGSTYEASTLARKL